MQLCTYCQDFFDNDHPAAVRGRTESDIQVIIHDNYASFEESRRQECPICSSFTAHHLAFRIPPEEFLVYAPITPDEPLAPDRVVTIVARSENVIYHRVVVQISDLRPEHEFNVWDKQASLPATLDVVRAWYASTDGDFRIEAPSRGLLPKRLLHVGSLEEPTLKLVETATTANFTGPYFTLSHCWGSGIQQRLTEGNYDAFSSSIPVETLSQTFQDAIYIVRFLGVAYLWIDALCIIQDSAPDWNEQAPLMAQIYGNASCCIAATRAADGEGLFSKQQTPFEIRCQWPDEGLDGLFYGEVLPEFDRIVLDSPLNRRAWVFQERLLSRRIVHFAQGHTLLQSDHAICSTRETMPVMEYLALDYQTLFAGQNEWAGLIGQRWGDLIEQYSATKLTHESDRIMALSGLATKVGANMGGDYLAGIWENWLLPGLCWVVAVPSKRERSSEIPSFSWASLQAMVIPRVNLTPGLPQRDLATYEVLHGSPSTSTNPYSDRRTGTRLALQGKVFTLKWLRAGLSWFWHDFEPLQPVLQKLSPSRGQHTMDTDADSIRALDTQFQCVPLVLIGPYVYGIVIEPLESVPSHTFRRIGAFTFNYPWGGKDREVDIAAEEQILRDHEVLNHALEQLDAIEFTLV